jgi:AcrR family transcriptional regulator
MSHSTRRDKNRAEILGAAARAISQNGFHGMSMRKLAQSTRRGLATFYNYFASKEEVLFELQRQAFSSLIETAEKALDGVTKPRDRLHTFITNHVHYFVAHPDVMQVLVREAATLPRGWRQVVRGLKESYFQKGLQIVAAVAREGRSDPAGQEADAELERATYGLFGMLNWVYGWYDPLRHGGPDEVAGTLYHMAMHGLTGQTKKPE